MYSKLLLPEFSFIVRGSILAIILVLSFMVYLGTLFNQPDVVDYLVTVTKIFDENTSNLLRYIVPLALFLVAFGLSIKGKQIYMGIISFIAKYSILLLLVVILVSSYIIYYKYIYYLDFRKDFIVLSFSTILLIITIILTTRYPLIAFGFQKISIDGETRPLRIGSSIVVDGEESIRIKIYGEPYEVSITPDPPESMRVSNIGKTMFYNYIDIKLLSSFGGFLEISYKDKLVYRIKCIVGKVNSKKIRFNIYFNDDLVGVYEENTEIQKNLEEAVEPIVKAVLSKIGVDPESIGTIQFYTEDDIHIPSKTFVKDLGAVDTIIVKIYSSEKHMEFLKYLNKKDVFELWDTLVKRLEILRKRVDEFIKELDLVLGKAEKIYSNWW